MHIPFVDLKKQYEEIKTEVDTKFEKVFKGGNYILGKDVEQFELAFADYCKVKYAVGVSSGTDALHIALQLCGVGVGDEVITTPLSFIATCEAISRCGAKPVFVDIDYQTYNINVMQIEKKITSRTKAILPVHLYGLPCDLNPIISISKKYNIPVIEDAAQAHGAKYHGKYVGGIGDIGCFSFYPGKNLGAYGDAGAITTNNPIIEKKARALRNHGREEKYVHDQIGFNNRMDTLQGAILNVKLNHLNDWNEKRRKWAELYTKLLENTPLITPITPEWAKPAWHLYVIRAKNRKQIITKLKSHNIHCGIHYPIPIHLQPCYSFLNHKTGDFPIAEKASKEIISLPIYPELEECDIRDITKIIINLVNKN